MDGRVVLLGRPRIEAGDRPVQLAGRKPWGLLAYLCLEPRATRQELAGLLFSAADDPLAALRWSLLQVRRALTGLADVPEAHGRLSIAFAAGVEVDVPSVLSGDVPVDEAKRLQSGELLEGLAFDDEPAFESWLLLQRSRVSAAVGEVLAWAASTLAHAEPEAALEIIGRATRADPFNDSLHELAVELRVLRGDRPAAEAWVRHVAALYGKELGEPAPETIRRPLDRPRPAADAPLIRLDTTARALLEGAQARFDAGDYQGGLEMARRAASSAAGSGDVILESRALVTLGGILVHSLRGRDREALGLLRRAQQLAATVGRRELVADAEREIGYVAFLEARYGAAEQALQRSIAAAQELGDAARTARALLYRGMCESDRCDYRSAEATIQLALRDLPAGEAARRAYGQAALARVYLRTGRFEQAGEAARAAAELARGGGAAALVPWAIVWAAEAALELGDEAAAETTYAEAYTLGCEIGDPCWEALALRGLALVARRNQRTDQARGLLTEAVASCRRLSDVYKWAEVLVLTELLELDPLPHDAELARARRLATTGPMPDLFDRLQNRSMLQTRIQTGDG
jgi:DNA-binding SARP family transcriptional activator